MSLTQGEILKVNADVDVVLQTTSPLSDSTNFNVENSEDFYFDDLLNFWNFYLY
jgi:hypothetical protein